LIIARTAGATFRCAKLSTAATLSIGSTLIADLFVASCKAQHGTDAAICWPKAGPHRHSFNSKYDLMLDGPSVDTPPFGIGQQHRLVLPYLHFSTTLQH
jgi:hypothetical protein